jgi:drug/metabolite transporter (DMT)-like permease
MTRPAPDSVARVERLILLTALAMFAFAANSVLARLAFVTAAAEPLAYTGIRLASGALALGGLLVVRGRRLPRIGGSWGGAAALFAYALLFSTAYVLLGAAVGALILFASVQIGIIGWAIRSGDRLSTLGWFGVALAFAALVYLVSPGLVAPNPLGAAMMAGAGFAWAVYTLIGRGSAAPLVDTAGNFIRTVPAALLLIGIGSLGGTLSLAAVGYAVASGVVASGLGYAVWYTALPQLTRTRAGIVQLTVPAIAAAGGVLLISEPLTVRLVIASLGILGGVALALVAAERRKP